MRGANIYTAFINKTSQPQTSLIDCQEREIQGKITRDEKKHLFLLTEIQICLIPEPAVCDDIMEEKV